jgi:hypothetical protein
MTPRGPLGVPQGPRSPSGEWGLNTLSGPPPATPGRRKHTTPGTQQGQRSPSGARAAGGTRDTRITGPRCPRKPLIGLSGFLRATTAQPPSRFRHERSGG